MLKHAPGRMRDPRRHTPSANTEETIAPHTHTKCVRKQGGAAEGRKCAKLYT
jgi:hypothetical protein